MDYSTLVEQQRQYFLQEKTRDVTTRIAYLQRFKEVILQRQDKIAAALRTDLNKGAEEAFLTEIGVVLSEISHMIRYLPKWTKIKRIKTPLLLFLAKSYIVPEPYGVTLILSPWNYPFQLALNPLVASIAAGNTAILKPSSNAPATSTIIAEMIQEVFPADYVTTVLGPSTQADALLNERFDYIFFTGSVAVGHTVMERASKYLTPVTLELGGKSPCILDDEIDLKLAAKRIAFGKLTNAGQTCIAPDYLYIKESQKEEFVKHYQAAVEQFYGKDPLDNPNYPKIVNAKHHQRLRNLMQGEIIRMGGNYSDTKIAPTLLDNITLESKIMQEEIFGPLLPMITYQSLDEIIERLKRAEKPLAFYLFTNRKEIEHRMVQSLSFGGATINDTVMHFINQEMGFGGVGQSGMGKYHGHESFTTFSHMKGVVSRSNFIDISLRYHPYDKSKLGLAKRFLK